MSDFVECAECAAKPGSPDLCPVCLERRAHADHVQELISDGIRAAFPERVRIRELEAEVERLKDFARDLASGNAAAVAGWDAARADVARLEQALLSPEHQIELALARLSQLNSWDHPGLPLQLNELRASLAAIRERGG